MQQKAVKAIHQKLHHWYQKHGRHDLPWRNTTNPYHIYLSEVMLQQTQVKSVLARFYSPFLEKFPSLESLSNAPLDEVLKMWEGLGYYTRARNLHKTAKITAPSLPRSYEALLALPGVGKNTASAICAFAYHQPYAVMEANVKRILSRINGRKIPTERQLQEDALRLLDTKNPYDYNQAMMDIGAMVCLVKSPQCQICPFEGVCQAAKEGYYLYPQKRKKSIPLREEIVLVRSYHDSIDLYQRKGRFLHGLWGFKKIQEEYHDSHFLGEVTQSYTHFKLKVKVFHRDSFKRGEEFFSKEEIDTLALSSVDKKVVKLLIAHQIL
jgi:A/G-specific adenine glycosylase